MALGTNSIGAFAFITLKGEVVPPSTLVLTEDRPGVDGTEFILAGYKGEPFTLVSQVDTATYAAAKELFNAYLAMQGAEPLNVIQGGYAHLTDGWRAKVVKVRKIHCYGIRGAVGNKLGSSPNQGFLEARWDLVAVPV
jgi:hypothetical protein